MNNFKIKFACHWDSPEGLADRVIRNWGTPPDGLEITSGSNFDYLITFNNSSEMLSVSRDKNIVFTMEPSWSHCIQDAVLDNSFKVFSSVGRFAHRDNVEMAPTLMFSEDSGGSTQSHVKQAGEGIKTSMGEYLSYENFNKPKKCSMILAAHGAIAGSPKHPDSLYLQREKLLVKIFESDLDIDVYGRGWQINDPRYKGYAEYKEDALRDYEFSIGIENSKEDYYISEKITDCFMNNCVPIYDGCNLAHEFYNPKSFEKIDVASESVIEDIQNIIEGSNKKYIEYVKESKIKYFTDYNIYSYLERCIPFKKSS
tara:strand:+ start:93 stop:1031 length:939 start_codon:yes stop_codon:yes gene_type:complete